MRIVKYNTFINEAVNHDALAQSVEDSLVELGDIGYSVQVKKERDNFRGICLKIIISKPGSHFKMSDIKEYTDLVIEFLDEGYTYGLISKVREYGTPLNLPTNIQYKNFSNRLYLSTLIDFFELEIKGIKGKKNIIRSYESSSYTGYSGFKGNLIEEIDNVLVELTDDNFWFSRELDEKNDNYILELCIEKEIPEGQLPGQIHDWYEDNLHMFFIRDVYEPLSLLVEWMQEKYSAELVEYNRGGTGTGIFKTEADEDYLESRVSSVRLKFIWKK